MGSQDRTPTAACEAFPLDSDRISGSLGVADRNQQAWVDASTFAERAAAQALEKAGLQPGDITAVVTSNTTRWAAPASTSTSSTSWACAPTSAASRWPPSGCTGGAQALTRAADLVNRTPRRPGHRRRL
ncbi:hypothetical protein ACH4SK_43225 [Streptomyces inhibens]|uniref:hypothetical protein n=1 Tax=Streptomyces inhibens TaxID=2293571 RepID=UPI00378D270C